MSYDLGALKDVKTIFFIPIELPSNFNIRIVSPSNTVNCVDSTAGLNGWFSCPADTSGTSITVYRLDSGKDVEIKTIMVFSDKLLDVSATE